MDIKPLAKLVQDMRNAQKEYFKARGQRLQAVAAGCLDKSKKLEKEVDAAISAILAESTPQNLF